MPDLEAYMPGQVAACGSSVVEALLGGTPTAVPARYAEGSPARLLPLGVPQVVVAGARDPIIPPAMPAARRGEVLQPVRRARPRTHARPAGVGSGGALGAAGRAWPVGR